MLINLPRNYTFIRGGRVRAYTNTEGVLKIHSTHVNWDDLMYSITYELKEKNVCPYCGKPIRKLKLTLDHMYPKSFGGVSIPDNLIPCCDKCNHEKGNLNEKEYKAFLKKDSRKYKDDFKSKVIQEKENLKYKKGFDVPNEWLSYCYPMDLKVRSYYNKLGLFKENKPRVLIENLRYIKKYNHLKRPIIVDKNFWILDGYSWYVAVIESGKFRKIPIIRLENVEIYF